MLFDPGHVGAGSEDGTAVQALLEDADDTTLDDVDIVKVLVTEDNPEDDTDADVDTEEEEAAADAEGRVVPFSA
jgi:hypothetical protein